MRRNLTPGRIILLMLALGIVAFAIVLYAAFAQLDSPFLTDLLLRKDDTAITYLSTDFRNLVQTSCPNGTISGCVAPLIQSEWGELREVAFAIGSGSDHTELYHTFWSNLSRPVSIVLLITEESGSEVVDGWRGFVVSEGENEDSDLLHGYRRDNEFAATRQPQ